MHLYDCKVGTFIPQATAGEIADILQRRFAKRMDQNPSESEVKSWKNSLGAFADAVADTGMDDAWIILEYQLPLTSRRIDSMIVGTSDAKKKAAVLVEFKQWDRCAVSSVPEVVEVGGVDRLHPSAQVRNYRYYLEDAHSAFCDGKISLSSCAYLHQVKSVKGSSLYDPRYAPLIQDSPVFCMEDVEALARFIGDQTRCGAPKPLVDAIIEGEYRPSKKLLDHVADSIAGYEPWKLLDEQQLIYDEIVAEIEEAKKTGKKHVLVVVGGPGTGKSVIALQVMGAAARKGYNVIHATGSKAFTTNLRGIVGKTAPFAYFNNFTKTRANSLDLIICDEAHRLRETSATRFNKGNGRPQVSEIIDTAKVSVFLLDNQQSVRANEVGSVPLITDYADRKHIPVSPFSLDIQFRTAGSESYINWVDYMLGMSPKRALAWKNEDQYEVKIFDDAKNMELALRGKMAHGRSARMVAGFCWEWSDPQANGSLVPDVKIGRWQRPWNRKPKDMCKPAGSPEPPARHPYKIWATQPEGFDQIGCIYSAQGFEFDYVGVIWGADLRWDPETRTWIADTQASKDIGFKTGLRRDMELGAEKLKHIYRVLSTRGMKGTYFYFLDDATREYFESLGE